MNAGDIMYDWDTNGFVIREQFFNPEELRDLRELTAKRMSTSLPGAYPIFSVSRYDAVNASDIADVPHLARMAKEAENVMKNRLQFFNSIYLELHASEAQNKPGLNWHQDTASFAILEKGTPALFCWTILENNLDDGEGTLEFIQRDRVIEITNCDLRERCVIVFDTKDLARRHGIDLTWKGRYVLLDSVSYQIQSFFDTPFETFAERPRLRPGDLVICNKDIMHRSAPTSAQSGERSALTLRFVDPNALYNGCLDNGIPIYLYGVYSGSKLWQRLYKEGRGAKVCD